MTVASKQLLVEAVSLTRWVVAGLGLCLSSLVAISNSKHIVISVLTQL